MGLSVRRQSQLCPALRRGHVFAELRALADALPLLRSVIETRKDQIAALSYTIRPRDRRSARRRRAHRVDARVPRPARPPPLVRRLAEDAARGHAGHRRGDDLSALQPRRRTVSLDIVDGATIKPLIGEDGRSPDAPDPAYQQVLHGVPAADFSADELLYLPRNPRAHRLYGMSPVEQIAMTINIALRRDVATLDYYRAGSSPDAFATLPKEWTSDQIRAVPGLFRRADERQFCRAGGR